MSVSPCFRAEVNQPPSFAPQGEADTAWNACWNSWFRPAPARGGPEVEDVGSEGSEVLVLVEGFDGEEPASWIGDERWSYAMSISSG